MENKKLVTPIGTVKFPQTIIAGKTYQTITVPQGYTEDKANKDSWSFVLTLDPKDSKVAGLLTFLDNEHKQIKKANFKPYKADKAKDEKGEVYETGLIAINFKSSYPPSIFDAKLNLCTKSVGWGSKVAVSFTVKPVDAQGKVGLGRYCRAIQVIELSEPKADYGFNNAEGYTETVAAASSPAKDFEGSEQIVWEN